MLALLLYSGSGCDSCTGGCAGNALLLYDRDYYEAALLRFEDNDRDGFTEAQGDCDDTRAETNPDASEFCNSEDDDCDGEIDADALDALPWYQDRDQDGYGLYGPHFAYPPLRISNSADAPV